MISPGEDYATGPLLQTDNTYKRGLARLVLATAGEFGSILVTTMPEFLGSQKRRPVVRHSREL
jgi:hypothetical protein